MDNIFDKIELKNEGICGVVTLGCAINMTVNDILYGFEAKEMVKQNLARYIDDGYMRLDSIKRVEDLPLPVFELLHRQLGIGFAAENGKLKVII